MGQAAAGLEFGMPKQTASAGYLTSFFYNLQSVLGAISSMSSPTDPKVELMVRMVLNTIVHDDKRELAIKRLEERKREYVAALLKSNPRPTNEERAIEIQKAVVDSVGDASAYYDEYVGISRKLEVGWIGYPLPDNIEDDPEFDASVAKLIRIVLRHDGPILRNPRKFGLTENYQLADEERHPAGEQGTAGTEKLPAAPCADSHGSA